MDYSAFHWSEKARKQAERAKEIVDSIGSVLHYKGSVATRADLPILGQVLGDMYNILSDGSNVVWNGSDWDDISGVVDLSAYRTASDQDTIDSGKVPTTRTINGKALSSNISLTSSDVGALPDSTTIGDATLTIQKNGTTVDTFTANATSNKTINVTVPTNTSELTNGAGFITASALNGYATQTWVGQQGFLTSTALSGYATETWVGQQGYITGITSTMVTNALGYTPYDASNPNGYTSNTGTVTSVNNVSPVSGNVTLSIPTVNNSTITITQGGVTKGSFTLNQASGDTIALDAGGGGSSVDIDSLSITKNGDDEIQTIGVINQNNTSTALKQWSGTKAQYDAIVTKDANTIYNITDDTNPTQALLEAIYPVGAIYIGTMNICPLSALFGTWQLVAQDRVLQGAGTRGVVGSAVNESLPNITGTIGEIVTGASWSTFVSGSFTAQNTNPGVNTFGTSSGNRTKYTLDASRSSSTYQDNAPVQQDAYLVNIWERTA